MKTDNPTLDILICTIGKEGIERIAARPHPCMTGVRYIVSWEQPDGEYALPESLNRDDFMISVIRNSGLSNNRNNALAVSSAPFLLISDDDVEYTREYLRNVLESIENNPGYDIIAFRYDSRESPKRFPDHSFDLRRMPKGYYVTSFEIALRRESVVRSGILFDTAFGLGAEYPAGEETLFIHKLLKAGMKGIYMPLPCCRHDGLTTGARPATREFIRAKGALFTELFPLSWPLRLITHTLRNMREADGLKTPAYLRSWLSGALSRLRIRRFKFRKFQ